MTNQLRTRHSRTASPSPRRRRFDVRRSPIDRQFRKWEQKWASELGLECDVRDYLVWVVVGVHQTRREIFAP